MCLGDLLKLVQSISDSLEACEHYEQQTLRNAGGGSPGTGQCRIPGRPACEPFSRTLSRRTATCLAQSPWSFPCSDSVRSELKQGYAKNRQS